MKKLVFVVLTTSLLLMMVLFSAYAEDGIQPCYTLTSLQQKVDNKWTTIATWTTSGKAPSVSLSKSKSVSKGYSYRVYVSGTVKNGSDPAETPSKTSSIKSY